MHLVLLFQILRDPSPPCTPPLYNPLMGIVWSVCTYKQTLSHNLADLTSTKMIYRHTRVLFSPNNFFKRVSALFAFSDDFPSSQTYKLVLAQTLNSAGNTDWEREEGKIGNLRSNLILICVESSYVYILIAWVPGCTRVVVWTSCQCLSFMSGTPSLVYRCNIF